MWSNAKFHCTISFDRSRSVCNHKIYGLASSESLFSQRLCGYVLNQTSNVQKCLENKPHIFFQFSTLPILSKMWPKMLLSVIDVMMMLPLRFRCRLGSHHATTERWTTPASVTRAVGQPSRYGTQRRARLKEMRNTRHWSTWHLRETCVLSNVWWFKPSWTLHLRNLRNLAYASPPWRMPWHLSTVWETWQKSIKESLIIEAANNEKLLKKWITCISKLRLGLVSRVLKCRIATEEELGKGISQLSQHL